MFQEHGWLWWDHLHVDMQVAFRYSSKVRVAQSCLTLCDPMDCSPTGSSVHGILQARIPEWVSILFSRGSYRPRNRTWVSLIAGRFFTTWVKERYSLSLIKTLSPNPTHTCITSSEFPKLSFMIKGSMLPPQVTTQNLGIKWFMLLIINIITFVAFNTGLTIRTINNACWYKSTHTPLPLCSHLWVPPLSTGGWVCYGHVKHIHAHCPRRQ